MIEELHGPEDPERDPRKEAELEGVEIHEVASGPGDLSGTYLDPDVLVPPVEVVADLHLARYQAR